MRIHEQVTDSGVTLPGEVREGAQPAPAGVSGAQAPLRARKGRGSQARTLPCCQSLVNAGLGSGGAGAMGRQDGSRQRAPGAGWRRQTVGMGTGKGRKKG